MPLAVRRLALVGAVALAVALAGCAPPDDPPTQTVTLTVAELQNPFFREVSEGARTAADAAGVRLEVVGARNDADRQRAQLGRAVSQDSEAVLVAPVNPDAAASAVRPLARAGIPVVAVDREVAGAPVRSTVVSDNEDGGLQAALAIGEALGGTGQVLHLQGDPQTSTSIERGAGFARGMEQYPDLDLATSQPAYFQRDQARRLTRRLLRFYPRTTAVFAENDQMALGAVDALGRRAGTEVLVVGFDGTPAALRAVAAGTMEATVAQRPEYLGQVAVEQAVAAIDGAPVAPRVPVGVELVTAENVGQYL